MTHKINDLGIDEIHEKYQQLESLEKTCEWLEDNFDITINRQRLSRLLKEAGLRVSPPNGWPDMFWEDVTAHLDPVGRLAAEIIRLAYEDLQDEDSYRIDKLSAAYFLSSELYELCLGSVLRRVTFSNINHETIPADINVNEVIELRQIYERNRNYWLP